MLLSLSAAGSVLRDDIGQNRLLFAYCWPIGDLNDFCQGIFGSYQHPISGVDSEMPKIQFEERSRDYAFY